MNTATEGLLFPVASQEFLITSCKTNFDSNQKGKRSNETKFLSNSSIRILICDYRNISGSKERSERAGYRFFHQRLQRPGRLPKYDTIRRDSGRIPLSHQPLVFSRGK